MAARFPAPPSEALAAVSTIGTAIGTAIGVASIAQAGICACVRSGIGPCILPSIFVTAAVERADVAKAVGALFLFAALRVGSAARVARAADASALSSVDFRTVGIAQARNATSASRAEGSGIAAL